MVRAEALIAPLRKAIAEITFAHCMGLASRQIAEAHLNNRGDFSQCLKLLHLLRGTSTVVAEARIRSQVVLTLIASSEQSTCVYLLHFYYYI